MDLADRDAYDQSIRESCERAGLPVVQRRLVEGRYGERKARIVRAWVAERVAAIDAFEKEIDRSIPRDANDIARAALRRSTWSTAISFAALVVAIAAIIVGVVAK